MLKEMGGVKGSIVRKKIVPIGTVGQLCALSVGPFVSCLVTWSRNVGDRLCNLS